MCKVIFDGAILQGHFTGADRYGIEILKELDKIVDAEKYEILIQEKYNEKLELSEKKICLKKIKTIPIRANNTIELTIKKIIYLAKNKALYVRFRNGMPLTKKTIPTIHDIYGLGFYDVLEEKKVKKIARRIWGWFIKTFAIHIVTVSEYSKNDIINKLHIKPDKISVIYNGWQHLRDKQMDDVIIQNLKLENKNYYFFIGRLVKNKNLQWVFKIADHNPTSKFVIAGALQNERFDVYEGKNRNIIYTGYISDSEMKSLMKNCKAFLFPSLMEGFGIPPLEALYNGVPIIISNTSCLPEIFENTAHYIDPYRYDYNLDQILQEPVESADYLFERYSWKKSAEQWWKLLEYYSR